MSQGSLLQIGGGPHIVSTGAPLSGKSEIARRLADELGLEYVSSGSIVREMSAEWPDLAKELAKGGTIDSPRIDHAIITKLQGLGTAGWILDGFPRFVGQYLKLFMAADLRIETMLWFDTVREMAVIHAKKRGREDDTADLVNARWKWFDSQTRMVWLYATTMRLCPVLNFFNMEEGALEASADTFVDTVKATLPSRIVRPGGNDTPPFPFPRR